VSDHITLLRAYQGWERCRHGQGGRQEERDYLHDNFLSGQVSTVVVPRLHLPPSNGFTFLLYSLPIAFAPARHCG
jgi:hypothetical protein